MPNQIHNQVYRYPGNIHELIQAFLLDRRAYNASPGTLQFYQFRLKLFETFCEQQSISSVDQVTPAFLRSFMLWLEETGHNPGGRHGCYRVLRTMFYWLEQEQDGFVSPTRKVKPPRVEQHIIEGISNEDFQSLLSTCKGKNPTDIRDKALLLFLLDTGLRVTECLNLLKNDLNMLDNSVFVRHGKGRKPRTVFFGRTTRRALLAYLKTHHEEFLWQDRYGNRLTYDGLRESLRRRSREAHLAKTPSPHDFRRAFALNMLRNGCDLITLQRLMGHADLTVLSRYLAQLDGDLHAVHQKASPVDHL